MLLPAFQQEFLFDKCCYGLEGGDQDFFSKLKGF